GPEAAASLGAGDHGRRGIEGFDVNSAGGKVGGIHSGSTADIENPLAGMEAQIQLPPNQLALCATGRTFGPEFVIAGGQHVECCGAHASTSSRLSCRPWRAAAASAALALRSN